MRPRKRCHGIAALKQRMKTGKTLRLGRRTPTKVRREADVLQRRLFDRFGSAVQHWKVHEYSLSAHIWSILALSGTSWL
jgi:hypothetical protein